MVLINKLLDYLSTVIKLVKIIREHGLLLELVDERLPLPQLVVVPESPLEQ